MKKRLLSAALALAMVLTMLPLSVFAAGADGSGTTTTTGSLEEKTTIYYHVKGSAFTSGTNDATADTGWYSRGDKDSDNKYTYTKVESGIVTNVNPTNGATGVWYSSPKVEITSASGTTSTTKSPTFTLLNDVSIDELDWTISNAKLNGHTLAVTKCTTTAAQSITASGTGEDGDASELKLTATSLVGKALTLKVTDAKVSGDIKVENAPKSDDDPTVATYGSGTITLTNCTLAADIDLPKGTVTLSGTTSENNSITIGTCAASQGGIVTLDAGSKVKSVALYGPSTLNVKDTSSAGDVTVFGGSKADVTGNATKESANMTNPTWTGSKINLETSGAATSIKAILSPDGSRNAMGAAISTADTDDTTTHTISALTSSKAGAVELTNGSITLTNAGATSIKFASGSVTLNDYSNCGAITLGEKDATGKASLTVSGDHTVVSGAVDTSAVAATDLSVKISGGTFSSSTAIALGDDYKYGTGTNTGITGGTFGASIVEHGAWLNGVTYEIYRSTSKTYTYTNSFTDAVSAYKDNSSNTITIVGSGKDAVTIEFILDDEVAFALKADPNTRILLPEVIGDRKVTVWYNGATPYSVNDYFPVNVAQGVTKISLSATSIMADLGTVNGVTAKVTTANAVSPDLAASIVGNTIKLSGAVDLKGNNYAPLELTFTTTTGGSYKIDAIYYDTAPKSVLFAGSTDELLVTSSGKEVALVGSTTRFTVDCSSLSALQQVSVASSASKEQTVNVTASVGTTERANLIAALKEATFDYKNSTAINQAINKALASYTESSIKTAITNGQRAYAQNVLKKTDAATLASKEVTKYNSLQIEVYLDIKVSSLVRSGAGSNGSITLDITPHYHEVIYNSSNTDERYVVPVVKNLDSTLLSSVNGYTEISFKLPENPSIFASDATLYAHHNGYVYPVTKNSTSGAYEFKNIHGFSSFTINAVTPVAEVDKIVRDGKAVSMSDIISQSTDKFGYESLTAAVADVANGGVVTVNANYTGATSIPVSGSTRQFTVNNSANAGKELTFTGASVTYNSTSNVYTVDLKQDTSVYAVVSVTSATGGTGTVSSKNVAPGQTFTFTATPSTGYQAATPTATSNNGTVNIVPSGTNTWTMTVPAGATTVKVTPRFVLNTGMPYTDVTDPSAWYYNSVKYCYDTTVNGYHLMEGDTNSIFGPNVVLNRAQTVQILYNMAGRPTVTGNCPFPDMAEYTWATPAVTWAAQKGYVIGYTDGKFHPEVKVSRQDLVLILYRYAGNPPVGNTSLAGYYDGNNVGDWALDAVRWATSMGILSGTNSVALNGYIYGPTKAKRCEVAVTIASFYSKGYAIN